MKAKLYLFKMCDLSKVFYAADKSEAKYIIRKFINYQITTITDINKLQDIAKELLIGTFDITELKIPLVNTAYYRTGDRVLWHNQPGYIDSYSKTFLGKRYGHQVNYNIKLDDGRSITNSRYDEIVNEATLDPNIEGISV